MLLIASFAFPPGLQRFWNWWRQQLVALIPETLRRRWPKAERYFITFTPEGEMEILRQTEDDRPLQSVAHDGGADAEGRYSLLLQPGQFLLRRTVLPAAARKNLNQVIRFEIDRHTPFAADQVYFDTRIVEQANAKIVVELIVVPRQVLDPLLALAEDADPNIDDVAVLDHGRPRTGLALLPEGRSDQRPRWSRHLNLALGALLLALIAAALLLPVLFQQRQIESLEQQVAKARKAAIRATDIQQRLTELKRQRRFLVDKKLQTPALTQLLEDLSRRLPDDTWLTQLRYRDGQLHIDGQSPAASKLVKLLEDSPYFDNVHFISPITQDRRSGLERFRISMDVHHGPDKTPESKSE